MAQKKPTWAELEPLAENAIMVWRSLMNDIEDVPAIVLFSGHVTGLASLCPSFGNAWPEEEVSDEALEKLRVFVQYFFDSYVEEESTELHPLAEKLGMR
jgi:hypothetical protein